MWHTCQVIMIVSLDIINNNQICCHSLWFWNVTGIFIHFKTIKLAIATTLVLNVRVPFNFTIWNNVVYTSCYVITYIIKTTEPNNLILILNLANKSYLIIKVNFCHLLAWFKNYDPLKVGVNSFWDTLYSQSPRGCPKYLQYLFILLVRPCSEAIVCQMCRILNSFLALLGDKLPLTIYW